MQQLDSNGQKINGEPGEVIIAPLPLYHIFAFTVNCMCMMIAGHHNVLITNPRDIPGFVAELKKWDFSRLKSTGSGGTALVKATAERWQKKTGCVIGEGYGLTECSPVVTSSPGDGLARLGSVGLPAPGTALKVIDENGNELPIGERGELCVKGPQVMKGYWNRPEATAEVLDADGWFRTGDIVHADSEGGLFFNYRAGGGIRRNGDFINPGFVEKVIAEHPAVNDVYVYGIPSANGVPGEKDVVAAIVAADTGQFSAEDIFAVCRAKLEANFVPSYLQVVDTIPKTASEKPQERFLLERFDVDAQGVYCV